MPKGPVIEVPENVIMRRPFQVAIRMNAEWRQSVGLDHEDVWMAGIRATTLVVTNVGQTVAGPCEKCCPTRRSCVQLGVTSFRLTGVCSEEQSGIELFQFDNCKSFCSSSRLHYGGTLVLRVEFVRLSDGTPIATVDSEQFSTRSRAPRKGPGRRVVFNLHVDDYSPDDPVVDVSPKSLKAPMDSSGSVPVLIRLDADQDYKDRQLHGGSVAPLFNVSPELPDQSASLYGLRLLTEEDAASIASQYNTLQFWQHQQALRMLPGVWQTGSE